MTKDLGESKKENLEQSKLKEQILGNFEKSLAELKEKSKSKINLEKNKVIFKLEEIEKLTMECQDLKSAYNIATAEVSDQSSLNTELNKRISNFESEAQNTARIETQFQYTKNSYQDLQETFKTKINEIQERDTMIDDFEKKIMELCHQIEKLEIEHDRRCQSEESLNSNLIKQTIEFDKLKEQILTMKNTNDNLNDKLFEVEENQKLELESLEHKISNFIQEMQIMKEENTLMFNEKKYLESVNITIKQGLDKYAEKYKEKKIEFKKLKHTGYELNETIKQLKNEKNILSEKLENDNTKERKKGQKLQTLADISGLITNFRANN